MRQTLRSAGLLVPGLLGVGALAAAATWLHGLYAPLSAVAVAVVSGLLLRTLGLVPASWDAGVRFAVQKVLRLAIILLGVGLSFMEVLATGGSALLTIVSCIVVSLLLVHALSRALGVPPRLGSLIGVGSCICGNSAIVATAPAIDASEEEVSFAVATISLFGLLAVAVYPLLGGLLSMSQGTFGTWAGTAINDTSQVVAAGYIFGEEAGNTATVVKLTRNLFMAPVIVLMGVLHMRQRRREAGGRVDWRRAFPMFVLGFLGLAALRTVGAVPAAALGPAKQVASFLIVVAMAGVGASTRLTAMRRLGLKPLWVGMTASLLMGGVSYLLIRWQGL